MRLSIVPLLMLLLFACSTAFAQQPTVVPGAHKVNSSVAISNSYTTAKNAAASQSMAPATHPSSMSVLASTNKNAANDPAVLQQKLEDVKAAYNTVVTQKNLVGAPTLRASGDLQRDLLLLKFQMKEYAVAHPGSLSADDINVGFAALEKTAGVKQTNELANVDPTAARTMDSKAFSEMPVEKQKEMLKNPNFSVTDNSNKQ